MRMGSSDSKESTRQAKSAAYSAELEKAYPGAPAQYHFVKTEVKIAIHPSFSKVGMVTSDIDTYYPLLKAQYAQGYRLLSFYRIPGQTRQTGGPFSFTTAVPFQGIFCRYPLVPTKEKWQLHIEKSIIQSQRMFNAIITFNTEQGVVSDSSHILQTIARNTQEGGRLVCIELTGQQQSQSLEQARHGFSPVKGVDLFFEMPEHPLPQKYVYNCVSVPIHVIYDMRVRPVPIVQCDWNGVLAQNLSQGWRLIEIFLDMTCTAETQGYHASQTLNSQWFFEKPASHMNDPTPVYEGTIVTYEIKIKIGFNGIKTRAKWEPTIQTMGNRGWELACILETPETRVAGMSVKTNCMLFFQRRVLPTDARAAAVRGVQSSSTTPHIIPYDSVAPKCGPLPPTHRSSEDMIYRQS